MCLVRNLESDPDSQAKYLSRWARLIHCYSRMALTKLRDRTFAFQGITSHIARVSGRGVNGYSTRLLFFDGLPVACFLPSLLWVARRTHGKRSDQSINTDSAKTRVEAECDINTLSWASIEGGVSYDRKWPFCATSSPRTTIFADGFSSGTFTPKKRTQIVHLFSPRNGSEAAEDDHNNDTPVETSYERPEFDIPNILKIYNFHRYRYCTRVLSLIHVPHLLSRVTLEGPAFSFTTECTSRANTVIPDLDETNWDHPTKRNCRRHIYNLIWFDLGFLQFSQTRLAIEVTCLTVIEWEDVLGPSLTDMGGGDPDSWQPDSAAGIVLIRSDSGGKDSEYGGICGGSQELYTRIGYWELRKGDLYRPPYGPIREGAKVRRLVVI